MEKVYCRRGLRFFEFEEDSEKYNGLVVPYPQRLQEGQQQCSGLVLRKFRSIRSMKSLTCLPGGKANTGDFEATYWLHLACERWPTTSMDRGFPSSSTNISGELDLLGGPWYSRCKGPPCCDRREASVRPLHLRLGHFVGVKTFTRLGQCISDERIDLLSGWLRQSVTQVDVACLISYHECGSGSPFLKCMQSKVRSKRQKQIVSLLVDYGACRFDLRTVEGLQKSRAPCWPLKGCLALPWPFRHGAK